MPALPRRPTAAPATARTVLIALAAGAACSAPALAQHMYTGEAGDNLWCNPMNWQPQSVPSGSAIIGPEITQRVRLFGCTPTFASLNAQGPVLFNGDVRNSASIIASNVIIQSGAFTVGPSTPGAATFSMNGTAQWLSGIIGNQSVRVEAGASLAIDPNAPKTLRNAALTNSGAVAQRAAVSVDGLSPITNAGTWAFAATSSIGRTSISNPSTFTNNGVVNVAFETPPDAPATFGLPVHNTGAINALTGDLTLTELTMNGGSLSASPGRRIELTRDSTFDGDCQLSGNGAVALTTGLLRINTGDTLSTLDPAGTSGGFTLNSSAGMDIEVTSEFRNAGAFTWLRGDIVGRSVTFSFRNDGIFRAQANSFNIRDFTFDNRGVFAVSTPQMFLRDANLSTSTPGVVEFRSGALLRSPQSTSGGSLFFIDATLRKTTPASARTDARVDARRSTLDITEGEFSTGGLTLDQSTVIVAPLADLRLFGNTLTILSRFTGAGTVTLGPTSTLTLLGLDNGNDMTGIGNDGFRVEGGLITGDGAFTNRENLTFAGGRIGENLTQPVLINTGNIFVNTSTLLLSGEISNTAGALIAFDSRMTMDTGSLLDNFGQILIGDNANIAPVSGSPAPLLSNTDSAIITKREPGVAIITAPLANTGEVFVQQGTLFLSGPINGLLPQPSPPFAPNTFSLSEGIYRVAPDAVLSFNGRLITHYRGSARVFVQGTCNDYEPALIRDQAFTEIGTLIDPPTDVVVADDAEVSLTPSGIIELCVTCKVSLENGATLRGRGFIDGECRTQDEATIAPGASPGTLTVGSLNMSAGGILEIELAGPTPGAEHDVLAVTTSATLGGTLRLTLLNGFAPPAGSTFTFLTSPSVAGQFRRIESPPDLDESLRARVELTDTGVIVRVSLAADFDGNGIIDPDDLSDFVTTFFATPPSVNADLDGNGVVDPDDLSDFINLYFS